MATTSYRLPGRHGLVASDGRTLTIKRKHLPEVFRGPLRDAFRSRVCITVGQVSDVLLNEQRVIVRAPDAIHWPGNSLWPGNDDYPLKVRPCRWAAGDLTAPRDAPLAPRSSETH